MPVLYTILYTIIYYIFIIYYILYLYFLELFSYENYLYIFLEGSFPTTGSPTVTLLRLHPSYWLHYHKKCLQWYTMKYINWSSFVYFKYSKLPWRDGRCVQDPGTYSPWRADPRLLAIPTSYSRVAENNPNWDDLLCFAQPHDFASLCNHHCSTCVAPLIRAMRTWRHRYLPPIYHRLFY